MMQSNTSSFNLMKKVILQASKVIPVHSMHTQTDTFETCGYYTCFLTTTEVLYYRQRNDGAILWLYALLLRDVLVHISSLAAPHLV